MIKLDASDFVSNDEQNEHTGITKILIEYKYIYGSFKTTITSMNAAEKRMTNSNVQ